MFEVIVNQNAYLVNQKAVNPYPDAQALISAQTALCQQSLNSQECLNLNEEPIAQIIRNFFDASSTWHKHFDVAFLKDQFVLGISRKYNKALGGEKYQPFDVQFGCSINDGETSCNAWAIIQEGNSHKVSKIYGIYKKEDKTWEETIFLVKKETSIVQENNPLLANKLIKIIAPYNTGEIISYWFWNIIESGKNTTKSFAESIADQINFFLFGRSPSKSVDKTSPTISTKETTEAKAENKRSA